MSMLTETIEIKAPVEDVWQYMDLARWPKVTSIFQNVESQQKEMAEGAKFIVTAGPGEEKLNYNVEILTYNENDRQLSYKRTGGPLPGTSEWSLSKSPNGTKVVYTNYYEHDLNSTILSSIMRAMEQFLEDLRRALESSKSQ